MKDTPRETFASRFGTLMTIVGVALGLGNVWRFPYMVGKFGGAAFVLLYVVISLAIGVPALMAEFALGRLTRRGPVGAFAGGGFPAGRAVGWFFFAVVIAATGYYTAVIGWVLYYAVGQAVAIVNPSFDASAILPPDTGFAPTSFVLQLLCTGLVIVACALVVHRGLRAGIERASKIIVPALLVVILVLLVRSVTLPGAMAGVRWYILKVRFADLNAGVLVAALGHAIFSLSLGGTFMVVYGSYLDARESLARPALWTVFGDTVSSLLAGFAVIPAVFALGLQPTSGPGLIFSTLPKVFAAIPFGRAFGVLFFAGLLGAGYLSDVGAFEVLVAGLTDNTRLSRGCAVVVMSVAAFVLAIPPTINNAVFVPWDLTFGSGMQTLGALFAVLTVGWCVNRSAALRELGLGGRGAWLYYWIRFGIPLAIVAAGVWWLLTSVLGTVRAV
ncbi:sodium:neurotransmitter symporter [Gemmatirosa kalamazoonensis]|uniref:Sodium:neurotransmitter symporter n=1 Tax=Gemmatirosa kalamazoonensis TaxID=861299 RepID=W0RCM8_9BACT|nr:sodium-dependent transporter [Gemmatirosa kalamazoonensis]AHG88075.1 sodium:neurotransmitter symporter [Gemmatirosa kalamazoonensis]